MEIDGSDPHFVTTGIEPSWSPDGERIVFTDFVPVPGSVDPGTELFVVAAAGGLRQQVPTPGNAGHPAWSPVADRIAYVWGDEYFTEPDDPDTPGPDGDSYGGLHTVGSDGSGPVAVRSDPTYLAEEPFWSPDGAQLGFIHAPPPAQSGPRFIERVAQPGGQTLSPTWNFVGRVSFSPDGEKLVHDETGPDGGLGIRAASGQGGSTLVPGTDDGDSDPSWGAREQEPDGDGDGVPDAEDACPGQAGTSPGGCPTQTGGGGGPPPGPSPATTRPPGTGLCGRGGPAAGDGSLILGTPAVNALYGTGLSDEIRGLDGNDVIVGARGADCLFGGLGKDRLHAGPGGDLLNGEGGADILEGKNDNDVLRGGPGADVLLGGHGSDRMDGGAGTDLLSDGTGVNSYAGGDGNDWISARQGIAEQISCGSGSDRATVDRRDRVARDCERVERPRRGNPQPSFGPRSRRAHAASIRLPWRVSSWTKEPFSDKEGGNVHWGWRTDKALGCSKETRQQGIATHYGYMTLHPWGAIEGYDGDSSGKQDGSVIVLRGFGGYPGRPTARAAASKKKRPKTYIKFYFQRYVWAQKARFGGLIPDGDYGWQKDIGRAIVKETKKRRGSKIRGGWVRAAHRKHVTPMTQSDQFYAMQASIEFFRQRTGADKKIHTTNWHWVPGMCQAASENPVLG
jgi:hypothetical protein